jgi:hypothetical protein
VSSGGVPDPKPRPPITSGRVPVFFLPVRQGAGPTSHFLTLPSPRKPSGKVPEAPFASARVAEPRSGPAPCRTGCKLLVLSLSETKRKPKQL